jgi:hypothetical protein
MKSIKRLFFASVAIAECIQWALAGASSALAYPTTTDLPDGGNAEERASCVDSAQRGAVFTRELRVRLEASSFESRSSQNQLVQKGTDRRAAIAEQPITHNFISTRQFSLA